MEILTGNELMSGATVYLTKDGAWVEELQQARLFSKDEAAERDAAIAATKKTLRINSLEIETVELKDGVIVPDRLRETIRAEGPTTPRFERQHLDEDGHVSILRVRRGLRSRTNRPIPRSGASPPRRRDQ